MGIKEKLRQASRLRRLAVRLPNCALIDDTLMPPDSDVSVAAITVVLLTEIQARKLDARLLWALSRGLVTYSVGPSKRDRTTSLTCANQQAQAVWIATSNSTID